MQTQTGTYKRFMSLFHTHGNSACARTEKLVLAFFYGNHEFC